MTIRGIGPLNHGLALAIFLTSLPLAGCGGSDNTTTTAGPDSTVAKAREAAHQEKLKYQDEQKAKGKR